MNEKQKPLFFSLPMNIELHSKQQVVYDRDLADSFLFPESTRSDYRYLYIASHYGPTRNRTKGDVIVSTPEPNQEIADLKKNVASVARFLKKAQEKGLCLEDLLDDETADTIISFLTEATASASLSDGTSKSSSVTPIMTNTTIEKRSEPPADVVVTTRKSPHKSSHNAALNATSMTKTKQKQPRIVDSKNGSLSEVRLKKKKKQKRHSKAVTPSNKKQTKQPTKQKQQPMTTTKAALTSLSTTTHTGTNARTSSTASSVRRKSDATSSRAFLDMLDAPNVAMLSLIEPNQVILVERLDRTTSTKLSLPPISILVFLQQPWKNFLHAQIKEKRSYNLKDHLKRNGGPDTTNLLVDASCHPICVDTVTPDMSSNEKLLW
jgi:hypothetical protein